MYILKANILLDGGNFREAAVSCTFAIAVNPLYTEAYALRAKCLEGMKETELAAADAAAVEMLHKLEKHMLHDDAAHRDSLKDKFEQWIASIDSPIPYGVEGFVETVITQCSRCSH
eukprot:TRINITY_DN5481_c0_g1::TRINITY_DN5481_c0_g1_i1::g.26729::m.26729 TRINITY_DN5481_c0_g1::TRINITY_DN5481_c0_g1_i1::g.26729  ORF type:complete len:135 (-),score=27.70,TPR_11/PF13414.1/9.4e-07,TPR_16/PF13432.1/6.2e-05,TPR_1/PF00515.23/0.04,TPR_1/PF00515.23/36,TPR_17/PF13431.1/25,TPR_17/PF13431.1/1.7,B1/PF02246.10/0.13,TPR_8/PF13181.1/16,TPR_8/PF13181.1/40 TRINITY_DN5481_c0_g1_i1:171-518(-)